MTNSLRKFLVEGIRNSDKPEEVKHHAEVLISTIDHIKAHGEDEDSRRAFQANYARLKSRLPLSPHRRLCRPDRRARPHGPERH